MKSPAIICTAAILAWYADGAGAEKEKAMEAIALFVDGQQVAVTPSPRRDGDRVLVPLAAFPKTVGAEAKELDGNGRVGICREDLCIPLEAEDRRTIDGEDFAFLSSFGEALGLHWTLGDDVLRVALRVEPASSTARGLAVGARPPVFQLPDLATEELVSSDAYVGRKTVFYMWASW